MGGIRNPQFEIRIPKSEISFPLPPSTSKKRPLPGGSRVRIMINHCNTYTYENLSRVKNAQYRAKRSKNVQQLGTTRKKPAISEITRNGWSKHREHRGQGDKNLKTKNLKLKLKKEAAESAFVEARADKLHRLTDEPINESTNQPVTPCMSRAANHAGNSRLTLRRRACRICL